MSFYANQEMLQTIEFERTREAHARRQLIEARRLARRGRGRRWRHAVINAIRSSSSGASTATPKSQEHVASSATRHLVAKGQ